MDTRVASALWLLWMTLLWTWVYACAVLCLVLSRVWLFVTPWTVARQAAHPWGFSRQEYWSGLPVPPPRISLTQGLNPHLCISCIGRWVLYQRQPCHLGNPTHIHTQDKEALSGNVSRGTSSLCLRHRLRKKSQSPDQNSQLAILLQYFFLI